jgi:hypothetical protein
VGDFYKLKSGKIGVSKVQLTIFFSSLLKNYRIILKFRKSILKLLEYNNKTTDKAI